MANKKIPTYLTDEQRQMMMEIPTDLSDRDLARYYTLTSEELDLVNRRRRPANRFGFAVQLALLRFPGQPLAEYRNQKQVPQSILTSIASQIDVPTSVFPEYGTRLGTLTGVKQRVGKQVISTPLGHISDKWKKHVILGEEIAPNQYEAAAFEALNARL